LSDLVGFVYSRMSADAAAEDLHRRIRLIAERQPAGKPATVSLILDGENAWEYYAGNGRDFLRKAYALIDKDPEICALTMSEAIQAASDIPKLEGIFPASWISANFDVWIGHGEDVRAWDLLRDARETYERALQRAEGSNAIPRERLASAYEALLVAEGSDWCWWFGPEHGSSNDAEFDQLYRKHLTEVYTELGESVPDALALPIKRAAERGQREPATSYLDVTVDGRETSYFEWMGAGMYSTDQRSGTMHGRSYVLGNLYYGFAPQRFYIRVDAVADAMSDIHDFQMRLTLWDSRETRITLRVADRKVAQCVVEQEGACLLHPAPVVSAAYGKILEVSLARELFDLKNRRELLLSVALWEGGLPLDVLPVEGLLQVPLGEDNYAWPAE